MLEPSINAQRSFLFEVTGWAFEKAQIHGYVNTISVATLCLHA